MYQVFSREGGVTHVKSLNYSLIQKDQNSDFKITKKDELIFEDELNWGQVHPCRHANGRDWWLIQQSTWGDTILSVFYLLRVKHLVETGSRIFRSKVFQKAQKDSNES